MTGYSYTKQKLREYTSLDKEDLGMAYIYSCEKFNPHNINHMESIIVDETEIIKSPAYLHTFEDKTSNEKYCVVSDNIGVPMPYLKMDNEFFVGTSQYIYFFDCISKKTERKLLNSPCTKILISHNKNRRKRL